MTQFSAQELLDSGARVICRGCNWLVEAKSDICRKCGHPLKGDPVTEGHNSAAADEEETTAGE